MEEVLRLIGNFGFPIVVSVYLLVRFEGKLEHFARRLEELALAMKERR